jgi:hypothetical protein
MSKPILRAGPFAATNKFFITEEEEVVKLPVNCADSQNKKWRWRWMPLPDEISPIIETAPDDGKIRLIKSDGDVDPSVQIIMAFGYQASKGWMFKNATAKAKVEGGLAQVEVFTFTFKTNEFGQFEITEFLLNKSEDQSGQSGEALIEVDFSSEDFNFEKTVVPKFIGILVSASADGSGATAEVELEIDVDSI